MPIAEALKQLGAVTAWVVNGDGLDEITVSGATHVAVLDNGAVTTREVVPEDAGVKSWPLDDLKGGDCTHNAAALLRLFKGEAGAYRDIVLINSAAALIVGGKARDLREGARLAADAIDAGAAQARLDKLIAISKAVS